MDQFTKGYIACGLWASTLDDDSPMDKQYDASHLSSEALKRIEEVCTDFQTANADLLAHTHSPADQNGHDFFLTRNHHGAGFWDRGYGKIGDDLTQKAHEYGSDDWYIGDSGLIYITG